MLTSPMTICPECKSRSIYDGQCMDCGHLANEGDTTSAGPIEVSFEPYTGEPLGSTGEDPVPFLQFDDHFMAAQRGPNQSPLSLAAATSAFVILDKSALVAPTPPPLDLPSDHPLLSDPDYVGSATEPLFDEIFDSAPTPESRAAARPPVSRSAGLSERKPSGTRRPRSTSPTAPTAPESTKSVSPRPSRTSSSAGTSTEPSAAVSTRYTGTLRSRYGKASQRPPARSRLVWVLAAVLLCAGLIAGTDYGLAWLRFDDFASKVEDRIQQRGDATPGSDKRLQAQIAELCQEPSLECSDIRVAPTPGGQNRGHYTYSVHAEARGWLAMTRAGQLRGQVRVQ